VLDAFVLLLLVPRPVVREFSLRFSVFISCLLYHSVPLALRVVERCLVSVLVLWVSSFWRSFLFSSSVGVMFVFGECLSCCICLLGLNSKGNSDSLNWRCAYSIRLAGKLLYCPVAKAISMWIACALFFSRRLAWPDLCLCDFSPFILSVLAWCFRGLLWFFVVS